MSSNDAARQQPSRDGGESAQLKSPLGWAVVGTGRHVSDRIAPALAHADGSQFVGVFSRNPDRAAAFAQQYGVERIFSDFESLISSEQVDVVYIATPNYLHASQTMQAARAGKHVLVEKPMALSTDDALRMIEICRQQPVKLGVGFHLRHHPAHREVRELLRGGKLGEPRLIEIRWGSADAGNQGWWQEREKVGTYITSRRGAHVVDLLYFLTEQNVDLVAAVSDAGSSRERLDQTVVALVTLGERLFASLVVSRELSHAVNTLAVYGTAGYAKTTGTVGTGSGGELEIFVDGERHRVVYNDVDMYRAEIEAFNRAVQDDLEPDASGNDGLRAVAATEALTTAWEGRQTVELGRR